jgi:hypothetical protein
MQLAYEAIELIEEQARATVMAAGYNPGSPGCQAGGRGNTVGDGAVRQKKETRALGKVRHRLDVEHCKGKGSTGARMFA